MKHFKIVICLIVVATFLADQALAGGWKKKKNKKIPGCRFVCEGDCESFKECKKDCRTSFMFFRNTNFIFLTSVLLMIISLINE